MAVYMYLKSNDYNSRWKLEGFVFEKQLLPFNHTWVTDLIYINALLFFLCFSLGEYNVTLSFKKSMWWKKNSRQIFRVYFDEIVYFNLFQYHFTKSEDSNDYFHEF